MKWWDAAETGRADGRVRQGATVDARTVLLAAASESDFREWLRGAAERYGWLFYFTYRSVHSPSGYPDATLCRPPRLILAELKTERGIVSRAQQRWLAALARCPGTETFIWRPRDWEHIERILQGETP